MAQEIIRFIGSANPEDAFGVAGPAGSAEGFEVEPSLLSLVCRELNERRIARGLDQIGIELLAGSRDEIIEGFYERCLGDQLEAFRAFVEDRLLSDSGYRESITLDSARRALSDAGVPAGALDELVRRRLLRTEERLGIRRVEIIHDVLTPVIRRSRDTRRLRQAETAAAAREAELHRERQRVRRAYWLSGAMALLVVITIGVAWWGWTAKLEAERQRNAADEQRNIAEQQRTYAERQQTLAEEQKQIAEVERAAASEASKRAEQNFDMAVTTADSMVTTLADRLRDLTGVPIAAIKEILFTAEQAFDQIASVAPNSQHLRWRRAAMLILFADTYLTLGDSREALRRAKAGNDIMLSLANEEPTNDQWAADLADSFRGMGDALCNGQGACAGDLSAALTEYRNDFDIMIRLNNKHPEKVDRQQGLAIAHASIGAVFEAQGELDRALVEYRASLSIAERAGEKDRENAQWQHKIAGGHYNVGNILNDRGDLAAASGEYRVVLDISRHLAEKDPSNAKWQRDLSLAHERMGDVLRDQRDLVAALTEYRADLDIAQRLAEKDPGNANCSPRPGRPPRRSGRIPSRSRHYSVLGRHGPRQRAMAARHRSCVRQDRSVGVQEERPPSCTRCL